MGISRDTLHKRKNTGGKRHVVRKKRKFALGRPGAMTKLGDKRVSVVRGRGGNLKFRALRLNVGNFSWASESSTRKARILDVVYNAANNELVRTNTVVKGCIVQIDSTALKQWYENHYGVVLGTKAEDETAPSKSAAKRHAKLGKTRVIDENIEAQFRTGRLLACISSRPGQCGRADGYVLEGKELDFYMKQMQKKKK